jgi:hypothetical protein
MIGIRRPGFSTVVIGDDCIKLLSMVMMPWSLGNGRGSLVEGHKSRVIGRGSKVEVEGQKLRSRVKSRGSKVENTKFLSNLKVLQPLNAAKQLVLLSKLKNFAYGYGYAVWLCTV